MQILLETLESLQKILVLKSLKIYESFHIWPKNLPRLRTSLDLESFAYRWLRFWDNLKNKAKPANTNYNGILRVWKSRSFLRLSLTSVNLSLIYAYIYLRGFVVIRF